MFKHEKQLFHPVEVERPNPQYAVLLQEQLGGGNGELKAAMQYMSQSFRIKDPEIKDLFLDIAAEELGHMEMVAQTINLLNGHDVDATKVQAGEVQTHVLLGLNPGLINSSGYSWTADYVTVTGDLCADLLSNIASEQRSYMNISTVRLMIRRSEKSLISFSTVRKHTIRCSVMPSTRYRKQAQTVTSVRLKRRKCISRSQTPVPILLLTMKPMRRPLSKYFKVTVKQFGGDFTYQKLHSSKQRKDLAKKSWIFFEKVLDFLSFLWYVVVLTGGATYEKYDKRTMVRKYHSARGQQKQLKGDEGAARIHGKASRGLGKDLHRRAEGDL